jgi:tRNA pseudouridine38-40 synthase
LAPALSEPSVTRFRIDLAYDGGLYAGFAKQPDQTTVQGALEGALSAVVRHPVDGVCAGRTDRGVHALAQVMHVDLEPVSLKAIKAVSNLEVLRDRLDNLVGEGITIWSVTKVEPTFDARFSATSRSYRYRLSVGPAEPRLRHVVWQFEHPLDVATMQDGMALAVGPHDFRAFCRQHQGRTTNREIYTAAVDIVAATLTSHATSDAGNADRRTAGDELHITLTGRAFCHQQVRAIVGSLVEVGRGRRDVAWFGEVLRIGDRALAGPVAPAHGLTLERITYPDPWPDAPYL